MAFSLSDRITSKAGGRIKADTGGGWRGNPADFTTNFGPGDKGGTGDTEGSNKGGPHSATGFRLALERTERTQGRLASTISSKKDTSGDGFRKPNQFAQGGRRHGLHIGSGSPATIPAVDTSGEDSAGY
jgi:hypothetical protein